MTQKIVVVERNVSECMYRKPSEGWLKHWDFMCLDLFFLQAAYVISYIARNGLQNPYKIQLYLNMAIVICLIDLCTVFFAEGYSGIMRRGYLQEFKAVVKHICIVCMMMVLYLFFSQTGADFSRINFLLFTVVSIILLYVERTLWKQYLLRRRKTSFERKTLLVITTFDRTEDVMRKMKRSFPFEIEVIGIVLLDRDDLKGKNVDNTKIVCLKSEILDYVRTKWIDGILINADQDNDELRSLKDALINMGMTVHTVVAVEEERSGMDSEVQNQLLGNLGGYIVLSTAIRVASSKQLFLKRMMDIAGGITGLVVTGVLTIFIAPAIYFSSPGPVFFSQTRVGKNGKTFKIYKFRSMYMDAEERKKELLKENKMQGQMFKLERDPRIIGSGKNGDGHGIGWFIRKTSIDEFPQFWNILKGDMSLVGTRPPTLDEWEKYDYHHRARLATKPGLTGLWQVSGRSDITDFEDVVKLDLQYIQNWSLELDIKILFKTIFVVLCGQGAK